MRLRCPWCGPRDIEEFRFRSLVTDASSTPYANLYERTATGTSTSLEYWQHERGCRAWLLVHRDPSTAEVLGVRLLDAGGSVSGAGTEGCP